MIYGGFLMSQDMPREKLASLVASFMSYSAGHLPDDVRKRLSEMAEAENDAFSPGCSSQLPKLVYIGPIYG